MKQLNSQFERWYKLTHWMSPELTQRDDDSYENAVVQAMYIAYRAGYNRSNKERKEAFRIDEQCPTCGVNKHEAARLNWERA